jgi:hypothetical protein
MQERVTKLFRSLNYISFCNLYTYYCFFFFFNRNINAIDKSLAKIIEIKAPAKWGEAKPEPLHKIRFFFSIYFFLNRFHNFITLPSWSS